MIDGNVTAIWHKNPPCATYYSSGYCTMCDQSYSLASGVVVLWSQLQVQVPTRLSGWGFEAVHHGDGT